MRPPFTAHRPPPAPRARSAGLVRAAGFTLIEVLVALSIMAVLAVMAWQGIDAMARTRNVTQAAMERTLRFNTAMAQWERDLQTLLDTKAVPALRFDGATLRLTREVDGGVQMVAWSFRDGAWWRWASPAVTRLTSCRSNGCAANNSLATRWAPACDR